MHQKGLIKSSIVVFTILFFTIALHPQAWAGGAETLAFYHDKGGSSGSPFGDIMRSIKKGQDKPKVPKPPPQPAPQSQESTPQTQKAAPAFSPPTPGAPAPPQAPPVPPAMVMPDLPQRDYTNLPPMLKKLDDLSRQVMLSDYVKESKQCDKINKASEKMMEILFKIYSSKVKVKIPKDFFVYLQFCKEASATIKEEGQSGSKMHQLNYQLESDQKVFLHAFYGVFVEERRGDFYFFYITSDDTASVRIQSISGWTTTVDQRGMTIRVPYDGYRWVGGKIISLLQMFPDTKSWGIRYRQNRRLPPHINVKNYSFDINPPDPLVFYSSRDRLINSIGDLDLGTPRGCLLSKTDKPLISPEKVSRMIKEGRITVKVQPALFSGYGEVDCVKATMEIEIRIPPLTCKTAKNSGKGAIAIAGDCIDHGGYILPSARTIFANGKSIAKVGDKVFCLIHGITEIIGDKKNTLYGGKKRIARVGDKTKCGATIIGGSYNTYSGSGGN